MARVTFRSTCLAFFIALTLALNATGDSYNPWCDQRVPSANGKYYVVMRRTGGPLVYGEWGPVEFEFAEIAPGSSPALPLWSKCEVLDEYNEDKGGRAYKIVSGGVAVRPGDRVLGRGTLMRPPRDIIVSSDGLGFVGLDAYGYNFAYNDEGQKKAKAAILVASNGKIIHTISLSDVFSTDELAGFDSTAGGLDWLYPAIPGWIEEKKKRVVIVGNSSDAHRNRHLVRFVDWESGKCFVGTTLESQEAIAQFRDRSDNDAK